MSMLRDLLAFLVGSAGVLADFFGVVDLSGGHPLLGLTLCVAGLGALWGAFRLGTRD
ncbi:hypothetical protein [Deinococcus koreensis]|uniref:hypothetical protein n=1 Tax=Deinococcus koreensis TaxID=2054903 RepID=UPI0013FD2DB6|nr:hypothetical protein [Deinococcus koreensis]